MSLDGFLIYSDAVGYGAFCVTPLQRIELVEVKLARERGDEQEAERLYARVQAHFSSLNRDFATAVDGHRTRHLVALDWFILLVNDHIGSPNLLAGLFRESWVLSYGDSEQQQRAALELADGDLDKLSRLQQSIERDTWPELRLQNDYAVKRLQAACSNVRLADQLHRDGDFHTLRVLLNHDERALNDLCPYLMFSARFSADTFKEPQDMIRRRISDLRAAMENPSETTTDPPPPYNRDEDGPPTYPEPAPAPARLLDRARLDQLLLGIRNVFTGWE